MADRLQGRFMTPRPVAQRSRQQNCCCVTTRRRNVGVLRCLRRRRGALTARTLGLGVLRFGGIVLAASRLPPRRLPAADQPSAFRILAVTLVPAPRLILAATAFAQAEARPRSSRTGTASVLWTTMTAAHGSVDLPRDSPGGTRYRSPRAFPKTGQPPVTLPCRAGTRQGRKRRESGVAQGANRRPADDQRRVPTPREGTRQGRKRLEKGQAKETMKKTPAEPPCCLALVKCSQLALFARSVPRRY
jgi:hypothetical protein